MTTRNKFLKGGLVLSIGQIVAQGLSAVRNILVARLMVTDADFGIASTLILIVSLNETLSNLGTNTLVIQDRDGDELRFLSVVHFVAFLRGVFGAVALVALAYPLASLFGVKQATWAFAFLGIIPLIKGLLHHDIFRLQRHFLFLPMVLQESLGQLITVAVCVPLLNHFRDYSAVVYLLVIQAIGATVLSHLMAKYPYRWMHDRECERRVTSFGIPLMLNGIFIFVIMQGERFVLGSASQLFPAAHYTMEDMAAFSAAFLIASMVPLFLSRVLVGLFMPLLSNNDSEQFRQRNSLCVQVCALMTGLVIIPLILFSDTIIHLAYRDRYSSAGEIIACAACGQALSTLRAGANIALLARGHSWDAFRNNLWRALSFPFVVLVASSGLPLVWMAAPAIGGETIAMAFLARQVSKRCGVPMFDLVGPLIILIGGLAVSYLTRLQWGGEPQSLAYIIKGVAVWIGFLVAGMIFFPAVLSSVRSFIHRTAYRPAHGSPVKL